MAPETDQGFEFVVGNHFEAYNFKQETFTPCGDKHKYEKLWYLVHGNNYVGIGVEHDLEWYCKEVSKRFDDEPPRIKL